MCNYIIGYDVINSIFEGPKRCKVFGSTYTCYCLADGPRVLRADTCRYAEVTKAFKLCGNLMPSWDVQETPKHNHQQKQRAAVLISCRTSSTSNPGTCRQDDGFR